MVPSLGSSPSRLRLQRRSRPGACPPGWSGASPPSPGLQSDSSAAASNQSSRGPGTMSRTVTPASGKSGCSSGLPTTLDDVAAPAPSICPAASGAGPIPDIVSVDRLPSTASACRPAADGQVAAEAALGRTDGQDLAVEQGERRGHGHLAHLLAVCPASSSAASAVRKRPTASQQSVPTAHPATASTWSPTACTRSPPATDSTAAADGWLPTIRLARRSEARSRAPAAETPRPAWPGRPRSWIRLCEARATGSAGRTGCPASVRRQSEPRSLGFRQLQRARARPGTAPGRRARPGQAARG